MSIYTQKIKLIKRLFPRHCKLLGTLGMPHPIHFKIVASTESSLGGPSASILEKL